MDEAQRLQAIGERAASEISDGDKVGLGTGSTANAMLDALAARVKAGLQVTGVATSDSTRAKCAQLGIPLLDLDEVDHLDLCIDGADEIDPNLNLVKGKGGALLYEKLVALRTDRLIIIASSEKLVTRLGTRLPVPVEVVPFGHHHTAKAIAELDLRPVLRQTSDNAPFITDGGHYIFDCESDGIDDPVALGASLKGITGVVDHGLFTGMTALALTIDESGTVTEHTSPER
jgi:ribose 5-phosphate isomerase A